MSECEKPVDGRRITLPVAAMIAGLTVCLASYAFLRDHFESIDQHLTQIDTKVESLDDNYERVWLVSMMKIWELRMRVLNPGMQFPDAWEIAAQGLSPTNPEDH